jgi:hypothetical protein
MAKVWYNPATWFDEAEDVSSGAAQFDEALQLYAMQEGIDPGELALAMEDRGWNRTNLSNNGEQPWITRRLNIIKSRMYWLLDPMAAAAVRTWTNYTLGSGITMKASDAAVQKSIDAFFDNPKNRTMTSAEGQRKHNRRLLVDGEIFFAFFDTPDGVMMRKVDCIEVTEFITDPEDAEVVWAYRRDRYTPTGQKESLFYRNWAYPDQDLSEAYTQSPDGNSFMQGKVVPEDAVLVLHLAFDSIHQRGNSLFCSTLGWMTHMRQFMEDRISITKGLAKYIQKLTFKGGKSQAQKVVTAMSALAKPGAAALAAGVPAAPGGIPGGATRETGKTFLQNDQVELSNMPRLTGASDAKNDHKLIRLAICAGVGMTEPYFGDAESGNLASATAMELPMLKQFESHQQLWADCWSDIIAIVANFDNPQAVQVDVDFPPIVTKSIADIVTSIVNACAEFPELKQPEVLQLVLNTLGLNNVEDIMKKVLVTAAANQAKAANIANGLNPDGSKKTPAQLAAILPTPVVAPAKPAQQKTQPGGQQVASTVAEALADLTAAMEAEAMELEEAAAPPTLAEAAHV